MAGTLHDHRPWAWVRGQKRAASDLTEADPWLLGSREVLAMPAIRVAAISDSGSFLAKVRQPFAKEPGFDFVGSCTRERLGRLVEAQKPDVLLVDGRIERPLDLCASAWKGCTPRIVVLAEEAEDLAEFGDLWKMAVLEAGAQGVLGRRSMAGDLVDAVRAVYGGGRWGPRRMK
jgi:DNA-binding NarL/FixJ family response regulator